MEENRYGSDSEESRSGSARMGWKSGWLSLRNTRNRIKVSALIKPLSLTLVALLAAGPVSANPVYVFRQADGTIRFSTQRPKGVKAKVFTAKSVITRKTPGRSIVRSVGKGKTVKHKKFDSIIKGVAKRYSVDPALVKAVIHAESSFNPYAVSKAGAMGLMQLMPKTARWLGVQQPFAITENINGGAKYLSKLLSKYKGNVMHTLAAYNAGETAVKRYRGVPPYRETRAYVRKVMALREQYRGLVG